MAAKAKRRRPAEKPVATKRRSRTLTLAEMQTLVAKAIKRNGENSILLDMATDVGEIKGQLAGIKERLDVLEPVTWRLETSRVEGDGRRKFIGGIVKARHAIYAAMLLVAGWLGITNLPKLQ